MKHIFSILFLTIISFSLFAQKEKREIPLVIGVYAPYTVQPGGKIGTEISFKEWKTEKTCKETTYTNVKSLFVSPQIALFVRPKNHISLLINSEVGFKYIKEKRNLYTAYSIGLGYLNAFQIVTATVDLSTGELYDRIRERQGYFLPTINLEFGKTPSKKVGWYSKVSYGRKISMNMDDSAFIAVEVGIKLHLGKKQNKNSNTNKNSK